MAALLIAYFVLAGLALVQSGLMLLAGWEHRRFARSRSRRPVPPEGPWPVVTVIAPCKGLDLEWEKNFRPLFEQDYPRYHLVFVVESESDPVFDALSRMIPRFPAVAAQIVVAGLAEDCGQKVHNLRRATGALPPATDVVAFVDSDARPPALWLRRLVHRLRKSNAGAVTGYRWFVPLRNTWANRVLVCLNGAVAGLLGPHRHNLIWGGSWAMRRETFETADIRGAWRHCISDDLAASRALRRRDLPVAFEPHCWLPAAVDMNWAAVWEFVRRQYLITRLHTPAQWWLALGGSLLRAASFWLGAGLAVAGLISGAGWWWWPAVITALLYAGTVARAWLRHTAVEPFLGGDRAALRSALWTEIAAGPIIMLFELAVLLSSSIGRRVRWRGVAYQVGRDRTVTVHRSERVEAGIRGKLPARHVRRSGAHGRDSTRPIGSG